MFRRTLFVVIDVALSQSRSWKFAAFAIFTLLCLEMQALFKPFQNHVENVLESVSLWLLLTIAVLLTSERAGRSAR